MVFLNGAESFSMDIFAQKHLEGFLEHRKTENHRASTFFRVIRCFFPKVFDNPVRFNFCKPVWKRVVHCPHALRVHFLHVRGCFIGAG